MSTSPQHIGTYALQERLRQIGIGEVWKALAPPTPIAPPTTKSKRKGLIITLVVLLLLVLLASGLGALLLLRRGSPIATSHIVGHAFFVSSGKLDEDSTQGINDELLIQLHNVPAPAVGTSYYAWLLADNSQVHATPILLGKMSVHRGEVNQLYQSPHNINLLTVTSRLLITAENANRTLSPTLSTRHYYAELPQAPNPGDTINHFSMLSHLRYLLSEDPALKKEGLSGGLAPWLVRNTGKVLEWAGSARDNWTAKNPVLLRSQLVSILEYLDGAALAQEDLPSHTQLPVDQRLVSIPILGFDAQDQATPGYLRQIGVHLAAITHAPGVPPDKRALVKEINTALNYVMGWLKKIHADAAQLVKLTDAQLLLPSSQLTLDEMHTLAFYAYAGRFDLSTSSRSGSCACPQAGVIQIRYDIEHLATLDIEQT